MSAVQDHITSGSSIAYDDREHDAAWWIGASLEASLRARAPDHYASTPAVRQLAIRVGHRIGLGAAQLGQLDLAVRVRDIGMLALPDAIVLATGALAPGDWAIVTRHPILGAELLDSIDPVASIAPIVRSHHERWDGGGYPDGTAGDLIPLLSRVIAACDAFVAIATDRPHRHGVGDEPALDQVCRGRDAQFDPQVVDALVAVIADRDTGSTQTLALPVHRPAAPSGRRIAGPTAGRGELTTAIAPSRRSPLPPAGRGGLTTAIAEFDIVPAFTLAYDRLLSATDTGEDNRREIVAAIESDTGLTIAVLRRAQEAAGRRPIANIPDAVNALTSTEIREAIASLPRAQFEWRTTPLEALMHHSRVHAQTVARAVLRIVDDIEIRDDLVVAALLHDIGKLVLSRTDSGYARAQGATSGSPEIRVAQERRTYGLDHASLGGLLVNRWQLAKGLEHAVASHHAEETHDEHATYVRLADMIAHHVQGDSVNRTMMLRLANACGLNAATLRDVLFDLPHPGGSDRRRAEPSPLSHRETAVLVQLAQGKVYKVIATELDVTPSTVRTHLHNTYAKLGVADRAQAVLKVTEMGWI
jgi:HD-GYP domain-containing protein (c-di-GMP phosphodiesterase class II)/DNA-binding CsgD family transcriptional regulator